MLRHAAACFKTPTNSSQNLALRHAAACCGMLRHAAACCCRWCLVATAFRRVQGSHVQPLVQAVVLHVRASEGSWGLPVGDPWSGLID